MKLNLKRPIVFFDLETTGVDTAKDRIVEISMVKVMPDGEEIVKTRKINPGIHIPEEPKPGGSIPGCISPRRPRPSTASRTTT